MFTNQYKHCAMHRLAQTVKISLGIRNITWNKDFAQQGDRKGGQSQVPKFKFKGTCVQYTNMWRASSKAEILTFHIHSSLAPQWFCLLPMATVVLLTSKVNLLNDKTYWWVCATVIVSSFGQMEQGAHHIKKSFDLLNEESVSGACSGRASL